MENVPGILTMRNGDAFKEIVESFEKVSYFVNKPIKLNAEEFGVPQKRKRIFIIGSKNGIVIKQPSPMFSAKNDKLPLPITVKKAIGDLPPLEIADGESCIEYNSNPISLYQQLMNGSINFKEFYNYTIDNSQICVIP